MSPSIFIPVVLSLLLGPGIGQLYNRDFKKAFILMGLSVVILLWAGVWYYQAVQPFLPPDLSTVDPTALGPLLKNATDQASAKGGTTLLLFKGGLMVLWIYGVVDAYRVAVKKMVRPSSPS